MVVFYWNDKNLYHRHHNACRSPRRFPAFFSSRRRQCARKRGKKVKIRGSDCLIAVSLPTQGIPRLFLSGTLIRTVNTRFLSMEQSKTFLRSHFSDPFYEYRISSKNSRGRLLSIFLSQRGDYSRETINRGTAITRGNTVAILIPGICRLDRQEPIAQEGCFKIDLKFQF